MRRILTLSLPLFALLSGCAGIDLNTLAPEQVTSARNGTGPALNGYVLYDPVVVVEISSKEVCLGGKDKDGNCSGQTVTQCAASVPFLLPDYSKPYLVASRSGFGKAGVDITISDGWRLGGIKDNSDNTAILSALGGLPGFGLADSKTSKPLCEASGLYHLIYQNGKLELEKLKLY